MSETLTEDLVWFHACMVDDVPPNGGACIKYNDEQIALFRFSRRNQWYATQNLCPHRLQMALSRGLTGSQADEPKISCPFHKKSFSLLSGKCLSGEEYSIKVYPVRIKDGRILIGIKERDQNSVLNL